MKSKLGLLCLGMTLMTGCQQSEIETQESNDLRMSIVARIGNLNNLPQGRYVGDTPESVEFGEGDEIGVFIDDQDATQWTYESIGWTSSSVVYWPDKDNEHTFNAFYPYVAGASKEEVPMPDLTEQTGTIESISNCDFLVATTTQAYTDGATVGFQGDGNSFKHISSLVELTIKGTNDLSASTLTGIKIEGAHLTTPASYSFTDGKVTLNEAEQNDVLEATLEKSMEGEDATFYFIVNEKSDESTPVTLTITYTTAGQAYTASLTDFAGNVFSKGMIQRFTLNIKDSSLSIVGSDILPWDEGEVMDEITINGEEVAS